MLYDGGMLLVAALGGYLVLERAAKQKGLLKQVGQLIGWFVMFAGVAGVICQASMCMSRHCAMGKGQCPFSSRMKMHESLPPASQ